MKNDYKKTELGPMPTEWNLNTINNIAAINKESLKAETDPETLINYIDIESVKNNKISNSTRLIFKDAPGRARRIIRENNIIVSTVRPYLRAFAYVDKMFDGNICSTGFAVLSTKENASSKFVYQYVLSDAFMNQIRPLMVGSNYPAISSKDIENFLCPIPLVSRVCISPLFSCSAFCIFSSASSMAKSTVDKISAILCCSLIIGN